MEDSSDLAANLEPVDKPYDWENDCDWENDYDWENDSDIFW